MTEAQIKEKLSRHYVGAILALEGYKTIDLYEDHGVDLLVKKVDTYFQNGFRRLVDSDQMLSLQLKCTTQAQVEVQKQVLKFDLNLNNFNDLVWRREHLRQVRGSRIPLALVLVVLPDDPAIWLKVSNDAESLIFGGKAFWFYPDEDQLPSKNRFHQRIGIPLKN
jgi:hypothetical protein